MRQGWSTGSGTSQHLVSEPGARAPNYPPGAEKAAPGNLSSPGPPFGEAKASDGS